MKKNRLILMAFFCVLFLSACYQHPNYHRILPEKSNLVESNHLAASHLIKTAGDELDKKRVIITASFVNINNLFDSSSFGRISSQQVATQFTNSGYHVIEMLLGRDVIIKQQQGEFLLSRRLKDIGMEHHAQAVLVGTYAIGNDYVYVTTKIIDTRNSKTISSYDYRIPKDGDINDLLDNGSK